MAAAAAAAGRNDEERRARARFGQVVLGPPGAGKTTYCARVAHALRAQGSVRCVWVNLDAMNDCLVTPWAAAGGEEEDGGDGEGEGEGGALLHGPDVDVRQLVDVAQVMQTQGLGPNGALLWAMEFLCENVDWLVARLREKEEEGGAGGEGKMTYVLLDLPGQIELFTHGTCVSDTVHALQKKWPCALTAVHLVDAQHCTDASKFIAGTLVSLTCMLRMELPHVNVLSKMDLLRSYQDALPFQLDFFTEVPDLHRILQFLDAPAESLDGGPEEQDESDTAAAADDDEATRPARTELQERFHVLNKELCDVIDGFGLVSFRPLSIEDDKTLLAVLQEVDRANGCMYSAAAVTTGAAPDLFSVAAASDGGPGHALGPLDIQERFRGS